MSAADSSGAVEYRPIPGFPGYEAGSDGTIWSSNLLRRRKSGIIRGASGVEWRQLRVYIKPNGYVSINLPRGGRYFGNYVHRLVLLAFVGPCPDGCEACHFDCDQTNNHVSNLRWDTRKGNRVDTRRLGRFGRGPGPERHVKGEDSPSAKLTAEMVIRMRDLHASGISQGKLAKQFGVCSAQVHRIIHRQRWKHLA